MEIVKGKQNSQLSYSPILISLFILSSDKTFIDFHELFSLRILELEF